MNKAILLVYACLWLAFFPGAGIAQLYSCFDPEPPSCL